MKAGIRYFLFAMLTGIPFVASGGERPLESTTASTLRGPEALQFLIGKTLRSTGNSQSGPTYRYFMNDHLEYRCLGVSPAGLSRRDLRFYDEANGCALLVISMKGQRLCEAVGYENCGQHDFALTIRKAAESTLSSGDHQLLGKVKLSYADPTPVGSNFNNPAEYDLFQGNATLFPDFDPSPRPNLLESIGREEMDQEERRCVESGEIASDTKIVGNTLVWRNRDGKFDGRNAEYFDPDGRIISIAIPESPPADASPSHPSQDSEGDIGINHWKIEKGWLLRTENDEPTKFCCGLSVRLQKPKNASAASQARSCVTASQTPTKYIVEGNPYQIGVKLPATK
ncbi:hypothetical protein [uncultured Bradyrhizobium sp.]|jgi:hypothetical protein|uniref:hypothetical protein n=1 Tax=uncultured Bradyrhizobium sp. TaxID=199684 RepID=UPI0026236961|nr:hypothetical protein [uncultured Bradyrhizobium sp.]